MLRSRSLFISFATMATLLSLSTVPAYADFMTGFEKPTYILGPLVGQDGWQEFSDAIVTVENFLVKSGSQAVFLNGSGAQTPHGGIPYQSGPYHTDTAGSLVDLSADIYLASSSQESGWQFAALGLGLIGFAGGIDVDAGTNKLHLITAVDPTGGSLTFSRDTWHHVDLLLNYTTQKYSFSLDGTLDASNVAFCGANFSCPGTNIPGYANGLFDTFGGAGNNDSGFMDNYSVSTVSGVPEPASLLLLGSVVVMIAKRRLAVRAKS
jgi:hypothetical protein